MSPTLPPGTRVRVVLPEDWREREQIPLYHEAFWIDRNGKTGTVTAVDGGFPFVSFDDYQPGTRPLPLPPWALEVVAAPVDSPTIEAAIDMLGQFGDALTSGELDGAGRYTPSGIDETAAALRALVEVPRG